MDKPRTEKLRVALEKIRDMKPEELDGEELAVAYARAYGRCTAIAQIAIAEMDKD